MRALRSRLTAIPRAALLCAAIATLNAVCWAAITPPTWTPDEVSHLGYAQHIAETGRLPSDPRSAEPGVVPGPSAEQNYLSVSMPFSVEGRPSWSPIRAREQRRVLESGKLDRSRAGQGLAAGVHPPLYYVAEAVPYRLTSGATLLDRLMAMRLLSALFAGTTVFFIFLFVRELLPDSPWAWVVGGLAVAFQPLLGFMGGGVNNDNLAFAASAALFYGVARAFHRGLRPGTGAGIGAAVAVGILTKVSIAGLLPGVAVGLGALVWRSAPAARRRALLGTGAAIATAAVPWMAWVAYSKATLGGTPAAAGGLASGAATVGLAAAREQFGYVWQALLPRLPFMRLQIPWYPPWEIYFKGFIGRFGWFEYGFPSIWYSVALGLFAPIVGLAGLALARARRSLKRRGSEIVTYAVMAAGLAVALEVVAYRYQRTVNAAAFFEQARYLFPLLPLYGALIAAAIKGAGRRWGPAVGGFIVVLAMGHSLFSQLLTIARFYS